MDPRLKYRKIRPMDLSLLAEMKVKTQQDSLLFEEKLSDLAITRRNLRGDQMSRIHLRVWLEALRRQRDAQKRFEGQLTDIYDSEDLNSQSEWEGISLIEFEKKLREKRETFSRSVIHPINFVRNELSNLSKDCTKEPTKLDQKEMEAKLKEVYLSIDICRSELRGEEDNMLDSGDADHGDRFTRYQLPEVGIPLEAWDWETHDDAFRADLLSDFIHVDSGFLTQIKKVQASLNDVEQNHFQMWSPDEMALFELIYEMYENTGEGKRRQYCLDFLLRQDNSHSKTKYTQLMDFFMERHLFRMKIDDCVHAWERARQELGNRVQVTLNEAMDEADKRDAERMSTARQRQRCICLAAQVHQWRKEKAELSELEFRASASEREATFEKEAVKMNREKSRRTAIKTQLLQRHEANLKRETELQRCEFHRMQELTTLHDAQRKRDTERLAQAEKRHLHLLANTRKCSLEKSSRNAAEKEARLEAIRATVRPKIPDDPYHFLASTACWRMRLEAKMMLPEDVETQELLNFYVTVDHPMTTFTDKQLQNDRRNRLSTALYEAGLLDSDYARNLLKSVPLPRPVPRMNIQTSSDAEQVQRRMKRPAPL